LLFIRTSLLEVDSQNIIILYTLEKKLLRT